MAILCLIPGGAGAAEAAPEIKSGKPKKPIAAHHKDRRAAAATPGFRYQGGVPAGPLYNGQDYLGDDPDPNVRSYLLRDMSRYGGTD
ncbi:MAG: hypothetical protein NTV56_09370 [Alphaproteobacteria bacterium]|nr:hypothetical protein [Alphaproteobacteria bacterium]